MTVALAEQLGYWNKEIWLGFRIDLSNLQVKPIGTIYNISNFLKIDTNFYDKVEEEKE